MCLFGFDSVQESRSDDYVENRKDSCSGDEKGKYETNGGRADVGQRFMRHSLEFFGNCYEDLQTCEKGRAVYQDEQPHSI